MNDVSITIDKTQLMKFLKDSPENMERALQNTISLAAYSVNRYAKYNGASGSYYKTQTGRLTNSLSTEIRPMQAEVRANVFYAPFIHDGTRYITARPFLRDAADTVEGQIEGILEQEIKKYMK